MMFNLLLYEFRKRRSAIIGWGIGLGIYVVYVMALYPTVGDAYGDIIDSLGDNPLFQMFGDFSRMTTFSGFLSLYVADYLPLILAIYAIINGTGALAGEEEAGTLELILSQPLARWQVVVAKALAMMVAVFLILVVTAVASIGTFIAMEEQVGSTDVMSGDILAMVLFAWPVVMIFMMLSLFLGALLPTRRLAAMGVTIYLIVSWFGNNLATLSDTLDRLQPLFPFYYYSGNQILSEGVLPGDLLLLLGGIVALLLLAIASFQRRNVTVGAWPWQRARVP